MKNRKYIYICTCTSNWKVIRKEILKEVGWLFDEKFREELIAKFYNVTIVIKHIPSHRKEHVVGLRRGTVLKVGYLEQDVYKELKHRHDKMLSYGMLELITTIRDMWRNN